MNMHAIEKEIEAADRAINESDFEVVSNSYAQDATLVVRPGLLANGRQEIREAYQRISDYFNGSLEVSQGDVLVVEAGDTALVLAKTFVKSPKKLDSEYPSERDAIYVYRKEENGRWLCAIDNSYGLELLRQLDT